MLTGHVLGTFVRTKKTNEGDLRLPVISSFSTKIPVEELLVKVHDTFVNDVRVRYLFLKDEEGNKSYYRVRDLGTDGVKDGRWEWQKFTPNPKINFIIVKNPNLCGRCAGKGVVNYGQVNFMLVHGIQVHGCFHCATHGFVL